MGRKPNLSSPVAVIRHALGLDAADFAALVGCGTSTIQHIETGDRPLKEELADRIHLATGVPRHWLFKEDLSKEETASWVAHGAATTTAPVFKAKSILEHRTSGGILYIGTSAFPTRDLLPLVTATFYTLLSENINPHLLVLALTRATAEVSSRFRLDPARVKALEREMHRYYFPGTEAARKEFEFQEGSPGFKKALAANKKVENEMDRLAKIGGVAEVKSHVASLRKSIARRTKQRRKTPSSTRLSRSGSSLRSSNRETR